MKIKCVDKSGVELKVNHFGQNLPFRNLLGLETELLNLQK